MIFGRRRSAPDLGFELTRTELPIQPTEDALVTEETADDLEVAQSTTPTPILMPTYTPDAMCGTDPEMLILAIGIDYRKGTYTYGLADVIRLVKVDFVTPRVSVLTLPRDFWVEVPGISNHYGITHSKLNQSYFYGTEAMGYYDGPGGGAGSAGPHDRIELRRPAGALRRGQYERAHRHDRRHGRGGYLPGRKASMPAILPNPKIRGRSIRAGWNHLNGKRAVYYARIRHIDNVFGRTDRQTEILCAVKNKLISPDTVLGIPDMITAFSDNVLTDLSPAQLSQLACLAPRLQLGQYCLCPPAGR